MDEEGGGEVRWGGGRGNRNAQVQKTQAKRAFFELVHCLAPKRPGSPALTGFPEPPALIGPKIFGSGAGGEGFRGFGGGTPPKFRGSARGRNAPSPLFKAEGLLSKKQYMHMKGLPIMLVT